MSQSYAFRDTILGNVESVCNNMAADGYEVNEIYKEGSRMYMLFSKWEAVDEDIETSEVDELYTALDAQAGRIRALESAIKLLVGEEKEERKGESTPE